MSHDADIVDYLLGELSPDEREAIERRMRDDADFRREVERMRPVVADLEALPPEAWDRDRGAGTCPTCLRCRPPPSEPRRRWAWPALRPVAAVAACAALIAAGLGIGALVFGGDDGGAGGGPAIALAALRGRRPRGERGGAGRLVRRRRADAAGQRPGAERAGRLLQPVAARRAGPPAVARGVPGAGVGLGAGDGAVAGRPPDFRYVDVSVEKEDGDPGHSGVSVLRGPTAPA